MQYMLLIYDSETRMAAMSESDVGEMMAGFGKFTQEIKDSGQFVAGDPLQGTPTARSVRVRNGETLATDGPFAETKEQLGGYYVVECADGAEAEGIAARIPIALYGSIEVRPVMVFG